MWELPEALLLAAGHARQFWNWNTLRAKEDAWAEQRELPNRSAASGHRVPGTGFRCSLAACIKAGGLGDRDQALTPYHRVEVKDSTAPFLL